MTLTEEQLAALKRVAAYMDEMYSVASPYHGCTEDSDLLRAMIDSSGTVEPTGGFDLERARGLRDFLQDDCAEVGDVWGEMIAEIERLRPFEIAARDLDSDLGKIAGERDEQVARIKELESSLDEAEALTKKNAELMNGYLAMIKELEADLEQAERVIEARLEVIDQQAARIKSLKKEIRRLKHESKVEQELTNSYIKHLHEAEARIKELEEALVEERTGAIRCESYDHCEGMYRIDLPDAMIRAQQELQAEGKIGPDAKPRVWQITEERKAALWHAIKVLKENDIMEEPEEHLWDEEVTVLQAMLTEAE